MIYRRKDSPYWWADFYDREGNRVRMSTKKADKRAARREAARLENTYQPASRAKTPLEKIKERYLKHSRTIHPSTTYNYNRITLDRFCSWVGSKTADPLAIENYKEHRLLTVTRETVNREYNTIRSMFNMAVVWEMLDSNPCHEVKRYRIARTRKAPNYFTKAQIDLILYKCESYLHDIILFAVHTGLRRTELVYLQWRDINFRNWTAAVQAKDELNWQPKSGRMRVVPIPKACHRMLLERKAESLSEFVFANQLGRPRLNNLNRDFRNFLKDIGLYKKGMGWHSLRHSFASHLAMAGVPLNTIGELLGHSDPKTTRIYSHLSPSHLKDATDKLDFGSSKVVKMGKRAVTK